MYVRLEAGFNLLDELDTLLSPGGSAGESQQGDRGRLRDHAAGVVVEEGDLLRGQHLVARLAVDARVGPHGRGAGGVGPPLDLGSPPEGRVIAPGLLRVLMAVGVLMYAGVGFESLILGGNFLEYRVLADDPVGGQHLGIALIELGVGITVAAVCIAVYYGFAGRTPE